jgi:chromosome segregation ATPase
MLKARIETLEAELAKLEGEAAGHRADFERERERFDRERERCERLMAEGLKTTSKTICRRTRPRRPPRCWRRGSASA